MHCFTQRCRPYTADGSHPRLASFPMATCSWAWPSSCPHLYHHHKVALLLFYDKNFVVGVCEGLARNWAILCRGVDHWWWNIVWFWRMFHIFLIIKAWFFAIRGFNYPVKPCTSPAKFTKNNVVLMAIMLHQESTLLAITCVLYYSRYSGGGGSSRVGTSPDARRAVCPRVTESVLCCIAGPQNFTQVSDGLLASVLVFNRFHDEWIVIIVYD